MGELTLDERKEKGNRLLEKLQELDEDTQNIIGAKVDVLYEVKLMRMKEEEKDAS